MFPGKDRLTSNGMKPALDVLIQRTREAIKARLNKDQCYCITTDGWTSRALRGHTTLTVHWLDKSFVMQSAVLGAPLVEGPATAENLYQLLSYRLRQFGLTTNDISAICIDQGANYQAMAKSLVAAPALPCICHLLNHVMEDVASECFDHVIVWANKLVSTVKNSSANRRALEDAQRAAGRPVKRLKAASSTRWFYFVSVLQRIMDVYPDLETAAVTNNDIRELWLDGTPSTNELDTILECLEPIAARIIYFQTQGESLIRALLPTLLNLYSTAKQGAAARDGELRTAILNSIRNNLNKRFKWDKIPTHWLIATCLDPRFKDFNPPAQLLPSPLDRTWPAVIRKTHNHIRDELHAVFTSNLVTPVAQIDAEMDVEVAQQELEREALAAPEELFLPPPSKKSAPKMVLSLDMARSMFGGLVEIENSTVRCLSSWETQWRVFCRDPQISPTLSALHWWADKYDEYPTISQLARKYLAIPVSAAASERVWSLAGNVMTAKRVSMSPETLDDIIMVKCNM